MVYTVLFIDNAEIHGMKHEPRKRCLFKSVNTCKVSCSTMQIYRVWSHRLDNNEIHRFHFYYSASTRLTSFALSGKKMPCLADLLARLMLQAYPAQEALKALSPSPPCTLQLRLKDLQFYNRDLSPREINSPLYQFGLSCSMRGFVVQIQSRLQRLWINSRRTLSKAASFSIKCTACGSSSFGQGLTIQSQKH